MSQREERHGSINDGDASSSIESFIERVLQSGLQAEEAGGSWKDGVRKELLQLSGPFRSGQLLTATDLNYIHRQLEKMAWEIEQLKNPKKPRSGQSNEEILR